MSTLVLELRPNEVMIINGAPIRFLSKSRIELTAKSRFLFGKKIMAPDQADTPARRIYFALQSAYIDTGEERVRGLEAARGLIAEFKEATPSRLAREILDEAIAAAEVDDCYRALKLARNIIRHEDAVLGRSQRVTGSPSPMAGKAIPRPHGPPHCDAANADGLAVGNAATWPPVPAAESAPAL